MTNRNPIGNDGSQNREMGPTGTRPEDANAASDNEARPPLAVRTQRQLGRRLILSFTTSGGLQLQRIEFRYNEKSKPHWLHQGKTPYFRWSPFPQALSLLFLDYVHHAATKPTEDFEFEGAHRGSPAATLGDAKDQPKGLVYSLFVEPGENGGETPCHDKVFSVSALSGAGNKMRRVQIGSQFLPADCIDVFLDGKLQPGKDQIKALKDEIRRSLNIPIEPQPPVGEERSPAEPETSSPPTAENPAPEIIQPFAALKSASDLFPAEPKTPPTKEDPESAGPAPEAAAFKLSEWFAKELNDTLDALREKASGRNSSKGPATEPKPALQTAPESPEADLSIGGIPFDLKTTSDSEVQTEIPPPPIDSRLFTVWQTGDKWEIDTPLVHFANEDVCPPWTIQNAFEGVLILGATGSGKSSGSGNTLAEAFLRSGFGGLILTVKRDEAEHWRKLCEYCGRQDDLIVVTRGGDWKLNILDYEAQCPGRGSGLSANLVALCNNLLNISGRSQVGGSNEKFWKDANDQLLQATFELFLLSGVRLTFDRLAEFVAHAPTERIPDTEAAWLTIPCFGQILARAQRNAKSDEDKRLVKKSADYWFKVYAGLGSKTRTSITLGVFSMLDAFRSRDIPAIISAETNFTPEFIMSGKIVVLDLPLKELKHTGLVVQSAVKYIFQTALERQGNSNDPARRPVFLWEDEGQYFLSEHDHHFQDTARSSRVSRVILSQNVHSFYKELGPAGVEAANSIFGNLITKIFHANSDPTTNEWAAKHFGHEIEFRVSVSSQPPQSTPIPRDFQEAVMQAFNPTPAGGSATASEHWEYAVRPEEFNRLRTGAERHNWLVDAYVTWVGMAGQSDRHFAQVTFKQNPKL